MREPAWAKRVVWARLIDSTKRHAFPINDQGVVADPMRPLCHVRVDAKSIGSWIEDHYDQFLNCKRCMAIARRLKARKESTP